MNRKTLILASPLVLSLGLFACDGRDYEAEIAELQGQLETTRGEAETFRTEAEELRGRVEELQAGTTEAGAPALDPEAARGEIETALGALSEVDQQIVELQPQLPSPDAVTGVRQNLEEAARAIGVLAQGMGIELDAVAPAGAGATEAQQPAAGGQADQPVEAQQPVAGETPPEAEELPEGEEEAPPQQQ